MSDHWDRTTQSAMVRVGDGAKVGIDGMRLSSDGCASTQLATIPAFFTTGPQRSISWRM